MLRGLDNQYCMTQQYWHQETFNERDTAKKKLEKRRVSSPFDDEAELGQSIDHFSMNYEKSAKARKRSPKGFTVIRQDRQDESDHSNEDILSFRDRNQFRKPSPKSPSSSDKLR